CLPTTAPGSNSTRACTTCLPGMLRSRSCSSWRLMPGACAYRTPAATTAARPVTNVSFFIFDSSLVGTVNGSSGARGRRLSPSSEIAGLDARHARLLHFLPRRLQRPLHIDRAAGVLDDRAVEAELAGVERGPRHAEIGREAADEDALDAALVEVALQAGAALAIGLEEGRVAVDAFAPAFANDELRVAHAEILVQRRAVASLHAVVGPQHLLAVGERDGVEG